MYIGSQSRCMSEDCFEVLFPLRLLHEAIVLSMLLFSSPIPRFCAMQQLYMTIYIYLHMSPNSNYLGCSLLVFYSSLIVEYSICVPPDRIDTSHILFLITCPYVELSPPTNVLVFMVIRVQPSHNAQRKDMLPQSAFFIGQVIQRSERDRARSCLPEVEHERGTTEMQRRFQRLLD
jgi:hypothetical protein